MGYWPLRPTVKLFVILRFTQNDKKWLAEDGKILKVNFFYDFWLKFVNFYS